MDLQFHPFGHWFVLGKERQTPHGQFWVCQCRCARQGVIHEAALVEGRARSCGCDYVDRRGHRHCLHDLTGQQYGMWLVLRRVRTARRAAVWRCRCACGGELNIPGSNLVRLHSTQCQQCAKQATSKVVPNRWYGLWFVLKRLEGPAHHSVWLCRCGICHQTKPVQGRGLLHGTSRSCGCGQKGRTISPLHQTYGRWYVLEYAGTTTDSRREKLYRCQCLCPRRTIRVVRAHHLFNGSSQSCGCLRTEAVAATRRERHAARRQGSHLDSMLDLLQQSATPQASAAIS
jgi:hypothetical protein